MDELFSSKWPETADELPAFFATWKDVIFLDPDQFRIATLEEYMRLYSFMNNSKVTVRPTDERMQGLWQGEVTSLMIDVELADTLATVLSDEPSHVDINLPALRSHLETFCKTGISHPQRRGVSSLCVNARAPDVCRFTVFPGGVLRVQLHKNVRKTFWAALMGIEWFTQRLAECGVARHFYVHRLQIGNCGVVVPCKEVLLDLDSLAVETFGAAWGFQRPASDESSALLQSLRASGVANTTTSGVIQTAPSDAPKPWSSVCVSYFEWFKHSEGNLIKLPVGKSLPAPPPHLTRKGVEGNRDEVDYVHESIQPETVLEDVSSVIKEAAGQNKELADADALVVSTTEDPEYEEIYMSQSQCIDYDTFLQTPMRFLRRVPAPSMIDCLTPLFFEDSAVTRIAAATNLGIIEDNLLVNTTRAWQALSPVHMFLRQISNADTYLSPDSNETCYLRPNVLALFKQASHADACHERLALWRPCIWKGALQSMHSKAIRVEGSMRDGILCIKNASSKFIASTACGEYITYAIRARQTLAVLQTLLVELRQICKQQYTAFEPAPRLSSEEARSQRARFTLHQAATYMATVAYQVYTTELIRPSFRVSVGVDRVPACSRELCIEIQHEVYENVFRELRRCIEAPAQKSGETPGRPLLQSRTGHLAAACHCHDTSFDWTHALTELAVLRDSDAWYKRCILRQLSEISGSTSSPANARARAQSVRRECNEREMIRKLYKINPYLNSKHDLGKFMQRDGKNRRRRSQHRGIRKDTNSQNLCRTTQEPTLCIGTLLLMHLGFEGGEGADTPDPCKLDSCFHSIVFDTSRRPGPRGHLWDYISSWKSGT